MKYSNFVINSREITKTAINEMTHPLNQNAKRMAGSLSDRAQMTKLGINVNIIEPNGITTEMHVHEFTDEFIYIISGTAVIYLEDEEYTVNEGDFIGLPANGPTHSMKNIGNNKLIYLVGGNKAEFDICNYPKLNKRGYLVKRSDIRYREFVRMEDIETK